MSEGLPSRRTTSYTRARSPRDRRSNARPGADQLRCNGSSTTARARATSSRGSRSGTQADRPRADGRWVNDTCGSAASSHPAPERSRAKVATVLVDREAGGHVEVIRAGGRVGEAVADGYDALNVAGAADNIVSLRAGSRPASQCDHAVGHHHVEPSGIG